MKWPCHHNLSPWLFDWVIFRRCITLWAEH